jgi:1-hydroxycarotenoid 3,4-desaturase
VVVVGAGISGLVSALLLNQRGLDVTLLDAHAHVGGKMRQVRVASAAVDSGPTVFSMRWVFDELLDELGESLDRLVTLLPLKVLAHHVWERDPDHALDLFADPRQSSEAVGRFAGPHEARRFERFCAEAATVYRTLEGPYIRQSKPNFGQMNWRLGPAGLGVLAGLGPFASLWSSLSRHFTDPRLRQLFGRYATYCGSSPWLAPATLMLVAQVEMNGVWQVREGMHGFAQALAALAERRGVRLRLGSPCERIEVDAGRVSGVRLPHGERLAADSVVFSGDLNALAQGLLGPEASAALAPGEAVPLKDSSLSAITWSVHAAVRDTAAARAMTHHNVFFADDYASEFRDIFTHRRLPTQATVYVCAQDRQAHEDASAGALPRATERLLCLVNAPATGDAPSFSRQDLDACEHATFERMARCGLEVSATVQNTVRTSPVGFNQLFPASGGALYGRATHGWMALFKRPGAQSRLPGLYLAGGGVHPGPGVPMAALSGRRAAEALMASLHSTSRSKAVAISGGMSTPSATTAATR